MEDAAQGGMLSNWWYGGEINSGTIGRNGIGGGLFGDKASGEAIDSFVDYLHSISSDYDSILSTGRDVIDISKVATDVNSFIKFYDDAKKGLQYLQEQDLIENDYYRSLESFINKNAANVEQYKKY
jgi:hypothetical protein